MKGNGRSQNRNWEAKSDWRGTTEAGKQGGIEVRRRDQGIYQALANRSVSAQELNAQLTQEFFNGVINNLRTQAECNRALAECDL